MKTKEEDLESLGYRLLDGEYIYAKPIGFGAFFINLNKLEITRLFKSASGDEILTWDAGQLTNDDFLSDVKNFESLNSQHIGSTDTEFEFIKNLFIWK